jgi:MFS family permease
VALVRYAGLSAFALGSSVLWNSVHPLLLPLVVLGLVADEQKNSVLGLVTFAGLLVAMVVQPLGGAWSDAAQTRWGRRRPFVAAGTLGTAALVLALGQAADLTSLLLLYVAVQAVSNVALGAYQGLIPDLVASSQRGTAAGAKSFAEILGLVVGALALPAVLAAASLGAAFAVVVAVLLAAAAVTCLTVREEATAGAVAYPPTPNRLSLTPNLRWLLLGRLSFVIAMTTIQTFALFYLRDVLRPPDYISLWRDLTAGIGVAVLLVSYPAGLLSDRLGRRPPMLAAGASGALGSLLLLAATDAGAVLLYGLLIGLAVGLFLPACWALATDLTPPGEGARFLGLTNLASAGGAALARLNGPMIDGANTLQPLLGYRLMLIVTACLFAAGALVMLKVRVPARA